MTSPYLSVFIPRILKHVDEKLYLLCLHVHQAEVSSQEKETIYHNEKLNFLNYFVHQVTTGITGLWQPSVHSDVAFF